MRVGEGPSARCSNRPIFTGAPKAVIGLAAGALDDPAGRRGWMWKVGLTC